MNRTSLIVMAAGIGSRFGKGIKQLEPVGPNGEILMDYSIQDALEAGFDRVVFIIRKNMEEDFKRLIGDRIEELVSVEYVFQEMGDLPQGFTLPKGREKPWGTGHAVLACKNIINEPFAVINADDYYGKEAFYQLHDYLASVEDISSCRFCMAGYMLGNTLSPNGAVTRGVCSVEDTGCLASVQETYHICRHMGGCIKGVDEAGNQISLLENDTVSMNMWGLTPGVFNDLENGFVNFLRERNGDLLKKEYLLPVVIDHLIKNKKAEVFVLHTRDKWFGVTYQEDKETVKSQIRQLILEGVY